MDAAGGSETRVGVSYVAMRYAISKTSARRVLLVALALVAPSAATAQIRPPSVPLVVIDPYFSIWSAADRLTDVPTTHWTGKPHRLTSLVRIDGQAYRLMGKDPTEVPALPQTSVTVLPTRTVYTFAGAGVKVTPPSALTCIRTTPSGSTPSGPSWMPWS